MAAQQSGHRLARMLNPCAGLLAVAVDRRGIAKALAIIWLHRLQYFRKQRRGRVVVEIDAGHGTNSLQVPLYRASRGQTPSPLRRRTALRPDPVLTVGGHFRALVGEDEDRKSTR